MGPAVTAAAATAGRPEGTVPCPPLASRGNTGGAAAVATAGGAKAGECHTPGIQ